MMCKLHYDDEGIVKTRGWGGGGGGGGGGGLELALTENDGFLKCPT